MMNPGPVEEAGKVATGFFDAMKTQPLALALAVMNIGLMLIFWIVIERLNTTAINREKIAHEEQMQIRELLSKCVVPSAPK